MEEFYRVKALRDFNDVKKGDIGGYIHSENNLSQLDDCWIYDNAVVSDNANIRGEVCICGDAIISSDKDYIVFKNWWSSGRFFTWTRSNNIWKVGCFYGTGEELIDKAYKDSEESGREYEKIVKYVERILKS